jgi:cell division GTPase FtsZ
MRLVLVIVAVLAAPLVAQDRPAPPPASEMGALQARVAQLEAQLRAAQADPAKLAVQFADAYRNALKSPAVAACKVVGGRSVLLQVTGNQLTVGCQVATGP